MLLSTCCILLIAFASAIPIPVLPRFNFNGSSPRDDFDDYARFTMLPLAAAAYSNTPKICLTNVIDRGIQFVRPNQIVSVTCNFAKASITCSGFVAYSPQFDAIIISYRGTDNAAQLIHEGEHGLAQTPYGFGNANVMKYFYDAWVAIWNAGLANDFFTLKNSHPNAQLWMTGHSLGGALASLNAGFIVAQGLFPGNKVFLVTFGQPRTGNQAYSTLMDSLISYKVRVTHHRDPVPHVPLRSSNWFHHSTEAFYDNNMSVGSTYQVCPGDSNQCSDKYTIDPCTGEHTHYYGHYISAYGLSGCTANYPKEDAKALCDSKVSDQ